MDDYAKTGMMGGEEEQVHDVEGGCGVECVGQRLRDQELMIWWTGLAPWAFEFPFPGRGFGLRM